MATPSVPSWVPTSTMGPWWTDDNSTSTEPYHIANITSSTEDDTWVEIVDTCLLSATILGALIILGSMGILEIRGRPSTTRMRLVQSLVVSDLVLGIVGLIGSAMVLSGDNLVQGTVPCDGLGFMLVTVLWTEHLWTLLLAFTTYMILIYPLNSITLWIEKKWYWLWLLVWASSISAALGGYQSYGFFPSGGICYYGSNSQLYGELMQFIPRGVVFVCISFFYARLFVFLRRPDKIRTHLDSSTRSPESSSRPRRLSKFLGKLKGGQNIPLDAEEKQGIVVDSPATYHSPEMRAAPEAPDAPLVAVGSPIAQSFKSRVPSLPGSDTPTATSPSTRTPTPHGRQRVQSFDEIPPWERVELPAFEVDGQRYGGSTSSPTQHALWGNWKGLGPKKRPTTGSTASSTSLPRRPALRVGTGQSSGAVPTLTSSPLSPPTIIVPDVAGPTEGRRRSHDLSGSMSTTGNTVWPSGRKMSTFSATFSEPDPSEPLTPVSAAASLPHDLALRRGSALSAETRFTDSRRSSLGTPKLPPIRSISPRNLENGDEDEGDDGEHEMDLARMLASDGGDPPDSRDDEEFDYVPESMASYLNRKTALLMLWFPLGYVLLFTVSMIRIIYDFASSPPPTLRALSRWFIFAQGILDALIYGLVEWHTKRVVRRRVRKGTFSPSRTPQHQSGTGLNLAAALRGFTSSRRSDPNPLTSEGSVRMPGRGSITSTGLEPIRTEKNGSTTSSD